MSAYRQHHQTVRPKVMTLSVWVLLVIIALLLVAVYYPAQEPEAAVPQEVQVSK